MNFLVVFLSGGLGSVFRYAVGLLLPSSFFPWCTLLVNVLGCFAIGVFGGLAARFGWRESVRLALTVGLCGGFTTFSTLQAEGIPIMENVPLARALWEKGRVDDFIPVELVEPVAEVLKWVKSLEDARREEEELDAIEITSPPYRSVVR